MGPKACLVAMCKVYTKADYDNSGDPSATCDE
jgi:hypothetical protein